MPSHGPNSTAARPRALRILMVEDHEDTSRVMARLLKTQGYGVCTAKGVQAALAAAAREQFDLLISDIGLPDGSGLDLMRLLIKDRPIKGIALSGYASDDDVRQCREAGFAIHITKPIDFAKLEKVIRELT